MEFRGYQSTYVASLPPVAETPLFQQHDSLYRLLAKACAPDPADRFASADELRVQLLGVLREVVAARDAEGGGGPALDVRRCCSSPRRSPTSRWTGATCRRCGSTTRDPQAGWLRTVSVDDPAPAARRCCESAPDAPSPRCCWRPARAALEAGAHRRGRGRGRATCSATTRGSGGRCGCPASPRWPPTTPPAAQAAFNAVYGQVPGELAPKLALALACETSGELDVAESLYATCARTDANYIAPAAFGLARIRATRGDLDGALAALDLVPADQPGLSLGAAPAGRAAGRLGPGAACPRRGDGQHRVRDHRATRARQPGRRRAAGGPDARCSPTARSPTSPSRDVPPWSRPCATASRPPTATWPATPPTRTERVLLVDRANAVRRWSLR